ncbi:hypothetical protein Tco_0913331 [Tanacetum coccineum]
MKNCITHSQNKAEKSPSQDVAHKDSGVYGYSNSYAHAIKIGPQSKNVEEENKPAIVLDEKVRESAMIIHIFNGKVKGIWLINKTEGGFDNIKLKYMGGYWVMIEFQTEDSKERFKANVGIGSWFSQLEQASNLFHIDERVTWVDIKGHTLKAVRRSDVEEVSDTIFENEQYQAHKKDDLNVGQNDIRSEDPFNIYDLLNKKQDNIIGGSCSDNLKYPPGFTPTVDTKVQSNAFKKSKMEGDECLQNIHDEKVASEVKKTCPLSNSKDDREESICLGHLKKIQSTTFKRLNDYLTTVIDNWNGEVVIMGDFNEVCLIVSCPNILAITLDCYLSDHRPILMHESHFDCGPIPFRFLHYWFEMEGFDQFVEKTWNDAHVSDSNAMTKLMNKMKYLKEKIRVWIKAKKDTSKNTKKTLKAELSEVDLLLDKGEGNYDVLNKRVPVSKSLQKLDKLESMEVAHKAKIKWPIEGDENSK